MDSCFPPLAALRLRDTNESSAITLARKRFSSEQNADPLHSVSAPPGKIEILQDLDLYYIRQIAHNLKVHTITCFLTVVLIKLYFQKFVVAFFGVFKISFGGKMVAQRYKSNYIRKNRLNSFKKNKNQRRGVVIFPKLFFSC